MRRDRFCHLGLCLFVVTVLGCGSDDDETGTVEGQTISGKIVSNGSPLTFPPSISPSETEMEPQVRLLDKDGAQAQTGPYNTTDGTFSMKAVKAGKYKIVVLSPDEASGATMDQTRIYEPKEIEIVDGKTDLGTIELKKR